jgi:hypothetical protein
LIETREYAERLFQEVLATSEAEAEGFGLEVFTGMVGESLSEAGEFSDFTVCYYRARGIAVSGWSLEDDILHLAVTDYRADPTPPSLTNSQIAQSFNRLETFVEKCLGGYADVLEESSPAFELADLIRVSWKSFERVKFYLFSDALARNPQVRSSTIRGVSVSQHVWDVDRLCRLDSSGVSHEPIRIDVAERAGGPIPCLNGPLQQDHAVFLMLLPGTLLADIYNEYGAQLLERNVRSYLQARGAVNKGIRESLLSEPGRFLSYNNGLSATAAEVTLVDIPGGGRAISVINDFQIVNGGQTTASIAAAVRRDRADVSEVYVQTKLTVVGGKIIDELVARISQYANTQNKVTGADFSANDPFFVALEGTARSIWAPAADGSQKQSHWFFERARGQYADDLSRSGSVANQRRFKIVNPPSQKFTKPDVAKFEHSWEQLPHFVSRGAEKNFREFVIRLAQRPVVVDERYFQHLIAKGILFRSTEKIVSAQKFGGYRANIVAYSIAKLAYSTAHRLDLDRIWRTQQLTKAIADALAEISRLAEDVISHPSGRLTHVGEWTKKPDCWARLKETSWIVPGNLSAELIPLRGDRSGPMPILDQGLATLNDEEVATVAKASEIDAETWYRLSNWAKETSSLQGWQRSLAYSLGSLASKGKAPSIKQSRHGLALLDEAGSLGFR